MKDSRDELSSSGRELPGEMVRQGPLNDFSTKLTYAQGALPFPKCFPFLTGALWSPVSETGCKSPPPFYRKRNYTSTYIHLWNIHDVPHMIRAFGCISTHSFHHGSERPLQRGGGKVQELRVWLWVPAPPAVCP